MGYDLPNVRTLLPLQKNIHTISKHFVSENVGGRGSKGVELRKYATRDPPGRTIPAAEPLAPPADKPPLVPSPDKMPATRSGGKQVWIEQSSLLF